MEAKSKRRNLETEYLTPFDEVLARSNRQDLTIGRGFGGRNRFDPGFDLSGNQLFQFGDLRVELSDRLIIVEVESAGGLTNLVKYWPFARRTRVPAFLLHVFGQSSEFDYIAHLRLWDFTWQQMQRELARDPRGHLLARRYTFRKRDLISLNPAVAAFETCLSEPPDRVIKTIFNTMPQDGRG